MYITKAATRAPLFPSLGKVKSDAFPDQLIAFTRRLREALPIQYRDFPPAALNQAGLFQLLGSVGDRWPLGTQHFGKEILRNRQCVLVTAIPHHEQPTRYSASRS